jgi:histidinol-phosphate phosphatase family protein
MKPKIVFIDRDGVINWDPIGDYIKDPKDFRFLPGVADALRRFTEAGYRIIVVSNQAGVGDGVFSKEGLDRVTEKFLAETEKAGSRIERVFYCLHGKKAGCSCRKPEVGLFHQAEEAVGPFDKAATYFIGDKITDMDAGRKFGLKTIFVLTGHGHLEEEKLRKGHLPTYIVPDLASAADLILRERP